MKVNEGVKLAELDFHGEVLSSPGKVCSCNETTFTAFLSKGNCELVSVVTFCVPQTISVHFKIIVNGNTWFEVIWTGID